MILQKQLVRNSRYEENKQYNLLYQTSLEFGYQDVTNRILDWDRHGTTVGKDYKYVRAKIKDLAGDLSGLTNEEKLIAAKWMCPDPNDVQVHTLLGSDYPVYLGRWVEDGKKARILRWAACKKSALGLIVEAYAALNFILSENLREKYLEGIEGFDLDGFDGLIDWLASTNGYSASGLINGSYTAIDPAHTMTDVSNLLLDIVQNGNYS